VSEELNTHHLSAVECTAGENLLLQQTDAHQVTSK